MKRNILLILLVFSPISFLYSQRILVNDCILPKGNSKSDPDVTYWNYYNLNYYIQNSASTLTYSECQTVIQNAFNQWSKYTQFTFTQTTNYSDADITISWETGDHGDNQPFYPNSNVLAHATLGKHNQTPPTYIHFNDYIDFSSYNLYQLALHEIGHVLGLPDDNMHTTAVMFGNYGYFTNLTYYDVDALYNIYGYPFSINGPSYIEQSETYSISKIHPAYNVVWSLSNSYYNQNCLQQNYPTQNKCTITRSSSQDMTNATLTATIKHNGVTVQTLTKSGLYAHNGFKGTYSSSFGSGQYTAPNPIFTSPSSIVIINSPNLIGATASYTGDATPTYWYFYDDRIVVGMPSTGVAIVISVYCDNGTQYTIPIIKSNTPYNMTVNFNGEMMYITLDESSSENQAWKLEIYNVVTGDKIVTQNVSGRSVSINTSGWKKGLYAARATIDKEVLTEKIQVK